MSEQGAQGGTADQANQNNEPANEAVGMNTAGQGSDGAGQGQALLGEGQQLVAKGQTFLIQEFHSLIRSALFKKVEEVAQHEYLKAEEAIATVVEWVREEAQRLGWTISDPAAHALAASALLEHKLDASDHQAVTPPPAAEQPAA